MIGCSGIGIKGKVQEQLFSLFLNRFNIDQYY